jgi:hypothetical protein
MIQVGILTCDADIEAAGRVSAALKNEGALCISNLDLGHAENVGLSELDALREIFSVRTTLCFVLLSKSFLARAKLYKVYDEYVIQARTRSRFLIGTVIDDTQEFYPPYSGIRSLDFFRYGLQTIVSRFKQLPSVRQDSYKNTINITRIKSALEDVRNNFLIEDITTDGESSSYFLVRATDKIELSDSSYYLIARFPQISISVITGTFQQLRGNIPKNKIRVILPKARRGTVNPEITLRTFSEAFQIAPERISYLNAFFNRLSEVREPDENTLFDPLFVPVSSTLDDPDQAVPDTLDYLATWATLDDHDPLLVVTAPGGYGKTTVIRKLHDALIARKRHVIYLDANEFVDHFRRSNLSITRSTLYEVLRSSGESFRFKENEFYLGWSLNNFIVIIDGLDEILARLTVEINVTSLLKDIVDSNEDGGGKIILTAREVFWDQSRDVDVKRIYLQAFDEQQARSLFEKYFLVSCAKNMDAVHVAGYVDVCMEDANAIGTSLSATHKFSTSAQVHYVPFVLEYIANEHCYLWKTGKPLSRLFASGTVRRSTSIFDAIESLIETIARREYIKMGERTIGLSETESIALQFDLLTQLAREERGRITEHVFDRYIDQVYGPHLSHGRREQLKVHFLLLRRQHGGDAGVIEFRYDFVRNIFAGRRIIASVADSGRLTLEDIQLIAVHAMFDNDLLRSIAPRLKESKADLISFFLASQSIIQAEKHLSQYDRARFIWSIASIILQVELMRENKLEIESVTNVVKTYFGSKQDSNMIVRDFAVVNYNSEKSRRLVFDWTECILLRCTFWEYSNFWDCRFDARTRFEECIIRDVPDPPSRVTALTRTLFAATCEIPENVSERLTQLANEDETERDYVRARLEFLLHKFLSGGRAVGHVGISEMEGNTFPRMKLRRMKFTEFLSIVDRNGLIVKGKSDAAAWFYEIPKQARREVEEFLLQGIETTRIRIVLNELFSEMK